MRPPTWLPLALALALPVWCQVSGSHGIRGFPDQERKLFKRESSSSENVPPPPPDVFPRFSGNVSEEEEDAIPKSASFDYDYITIVDVCDGDYEVHAGEGILFYSRHDNKSFECNNTFRAASPLEKVHVFCPHVFLRFNCFFEELYVYTEGSSQTTEDRFCRTSTTLTTRGEAIRFSYFPRVTLFSSGYVCLVGVPPSATTTTAAAQLQETNTKVKCGVTALSRRHSGMRVIGGNAAEENAHPWMVYLKIRLSGSSKGEIRCGGTLVSPYVIVTAAHCVDFAIDHITVGLGLINHTDTSLGTIWRKTSNFTKHPEYNPYKILNDVALVFLTEPVPRTDRVRHICLPKEVDYAFLKAKATGWGNLAYEGNASLTLQEVELEVMDNAKCQEGWQKLLDEHMTIDSTQVCAYGVGKDTCTGDSGGPLGVEVDGQVVLVGVTSFGYKCATPGVGGVYTRVSKFLKWIEKYLGGEFAEEKATERRSRRKIVPL